MRKWQLGTLGAVWWASGTSAAMAAGEAPHIDGTSLGLIWILPFAGILLSIATGPVLYPHLWEHHFGKFALFWSACVMKLSSTDSSAGIAPRNF